jgi:2',3'-cyclic-nucleotide 2'-phosphodiesterase (5'-nucleotidase family)
LHLDLGDYFMPLGPGSDIVNELMKQSLDILPIQVMNLGPEDLQMWKELSQLKLKTTAIISTNLSPRDRVLPVPRRYAVVEVPAAKLGLKKNLRLGFLGLTNPVQLKPASPFTAQDPIEAVAKIKPEVLKKADYLIVLAEVPKSTAIRLAQDNPEIYAIMMIERSVIEHTPEQVNNAVLVWSMERGRNLGQLILELDQNGGISVFKPQKVVLDASITEDRALLKRQNEIKAQVPAGAGH